MESRVTSFRQGSYASAIMDLSNLEENLNKVAVGTKFYFNVTMANGTSRVFYVILEPSANEEETGGFIFKFFRDYTVYTVTEYSGYEDFLIKGYYFGACLPEEIGDQAIGKSTTGSVRNDMSNYVKIFLDALQVMSVMPF